MKASQWANLMWTEPRLQVAASWLQLGGWSPADWRLFLNRSVTTELNLAMLITPRLSHRKLTLWTHWSGRFEEVGLGLGVDALVRRSSSSLKSTFDQEVFMGLTWVAWADDGRRAAVLRTTARDRTFSPWGLGGTVSRRNTSFCQWTSVRLPSGATSMTRRQRSEDHASPRSPSLHRPGVHTTHSLLFIHDSYCALMLSPGCSLVSRGWTRGDGPRCGMERVHHCGQGSCARYSCIYTQLYQGLDVNLAFKTVVCVRVCLML